MFNLEWDKDVNTHLPSGTNNAKRRDETVRIELVRHMEDENTVLLGDFNCVENLRDVYSQSKNSQKQKASEDLKEHILAFQMKDIWAEKNTVQGFTRIDKRGASRIDRIYVSENLAEKVKRDENICAAFWTI